MRVAGWEQRSFVAFGGSRRLTHTVLAYDYRHLTMSWWACDESAQLLEMHIPLKCGKSTSALALQAAKAAAAQAQADYENRCWSAQLKLERQSLVLNMRQVRSREPVPQPNQ